MKRLLVFVLLLIPFYTLDRVLFFLIRPCAYFFQNWICNFISFNFFHIKWRRFTKESRVKKRKEKEENTRRKNQQKKKALKSAGIKKLHSDYRCNYFFCHNSLSVFTNYVLLPDRI